jgi:hypothetical protein
VIVFYKMDYVSLIEIEIKSAQTLESLVAYWHVDMACPQHAPTNGVVNPNTSHDTIEINIVVLVKILPFSSLTYAITRALNPCLQGLHSPCKSMAFLKVSIISKEPMVT